MKEIGIHTIAFFLYINSVYKLSIFTLWAVNNYQTCIIKEENIKKFNEWTPFSWMFVGG